MRWLLLTILLSGSLLSNSQSCSCSELIKELISKTQSDYAGYIHKVKEKDSSGYVALKKLLLDEAEHTSFIDCYDLLDRYIRFFKDGHLFVIELPPNKPDSFIRFIKKYPVPSEENMINRSYHFQDSIEGIWVGKNDLKVAIVPSGKNKFYGVVMHADAPQWTSGMIKMKIEKRGPNSYDVSYYRDDFARQRFTEVSIDKKVFLSMGTVKLAKWYPQNAESSYINYKDPELPIIKKLDKDIVLLTVPSALIESAYLDSLLNKNDSLIKSSPYLIVDLRGNTGGNFIWGGLYDIANTIVKPEVKTSEADALMLASEDDAKYVSRMSSYVRSKKDSAGIRYYDSVIDNIRENIGKIVPFSFYNTFVDTATRIVFKYPRKIALIIDKSVASAPEAYILGEKENSSKLTSYGANTHGMIDYQSVYMIPIGDKQNRWYYFGYPTMFSKEIRTNPYNQTGIKADIYVPSGVTDWVNWVAHDLK